MNADGGGAVTEISGVKIRGLELPAILTPPLYWWTVGGHHWGVATAALGSPPMWGGLPAWPHNAGSMPGGHTAAPLHGGALECAQDPPARRAGVGCQGKPVLGSWGAFPTSPFVLCHPRATSGGPRPCSFPSITTRLRAAGGCCEGQQPHVDRCRDAPGVGFG